MCGPRPRNSDGLDLECKAVGAMIGYAGIGTDVEDMSAAGQALRFARQGPSQWARASSRKRLGAPRRLPPR
jgi:hypothetical protein